MTFDRSPLRQARPIAHDLRLLVLAATVLAAPLAWAQSPANGNCPTLSVSGVNLAENPNLEIPDPAVPLGQWECWQAGDPPQPISAASGWRMHSSNNSAKVCSRLQKASAPGPGGTYKLYFDAGGNEGGIYQDVVTDPTKKYMLSAWVFVRSGVVAIQSKSNRFVGGPAGYTTKTGEWEQLRVCSNGLTTTNQLVIYNQAPEGGKFYVDRVELREIF